MRTLAHSARGEKSPLRRHRHEDIFVSKETSSQEITTLEIVVVKERQGEKTCSLDITNTEVLVGSRQNFKLSSCYSFQKSMNNFSICLLRFFQVCLSEVDSGKKFNDVEVEDTEAKVTKDNANDKSARN